MLKKKNKSPIKFLIAAMGPGEVTQGTGLARYLLEKKAGLVFVIRLKKNLSFLKNRENRLKVLFADTSEKFKKIFEREKPSIFVLCNSKIVSYYKDFLKNPPQPRPVTVSLDSNWLFSKRDKWYSLVNWADKHLILFPPKIFNLGLKKYGGNYAIPESIIKKLETVGFIPSWRKLSLKNRLGLRKKYKIGKDEKLIFSYFGGFGAGFRHWALKNLIKAVENMTREGLKIRVIYVAPQKNSKPSLPEKSWLIKERTLTENNFFSILSSSDLVFQHQGIGTLAQAISARIPVIANVRDPEDEPYPRHAHAWEINPFVKLNLCKMLYRSTPLEEIQKEIRALLYDKKEVKKMRDAQKKYYKAGESRAYKIIMELLKTKGI